MPCPAIRVELVYGSPELHTGALDLLDGHRYLPLSYADAFGLALARSRGITEAFTLDSSWAACGVQPIGYA